AALPDSEGDNRKSVVADFDADGAIDLVLGSVEGGLRLYRGDGAGSFTPGDIFAAGAGPVQALIAADVDGDGAVDLVQGTEELPNSVHWNDGHGVFATQRLDAEPADTYGVAVGDMDGDGRPDIVFANSQSPNEVIFGRE
ncbi:MAG: VCBS repeat-containing protein, partial [Parasphingopyxis sp.]